MTDQQQNDVPEDISEEAVKKMEMRIIISIIGVIIFIGGIAGMYFYNFHGSLSGNGDTWGTFGDYIGGILNPTIAALALYWLISSIKLQIIELKETNKSLKATVDTTRKQQEQIALQNFESLFFELLKNKSEITKDIQAGSYSELLKISGYDDYNSHLQTKIDEKTTIMTEKNNSSKGKESIKDHVIFFKNFSVYSWDDFYNISLDDYFGSYFRMCYQITKLIDQNKALNSLKLINESFSKDQKKYSDIFRAQLSSYELEALFFNCLSVHGKQKFKPLVEKYGLFEHMLLDNERPTEWRHRLTRYAYQYKIEAFEKNKYWKNYFEEIKNIYLGIDINELEEAINHLEKAHFILTTNSKKKLEYNYIINPNIKSNDLNNIITIENIKSIKEDTEGFYIKHINKIKELEQEFLVSTLSTITNQKTSLTEKLTQSLLLDLPLNSNINKLKIEKNHLDEAFSDLLNIKYASTIFTLIKYGISYTEYSEYKKSNPSPPHP